MKETRKQYISLKLNNQPRKLILGSRLKNFEEYWSLKNEYTPDNESKITYNVDRKCNFLQTQKNTPWKFSQKFYYKDDQFLLGPYEEPIRKVVRDIDISKDRLLVIKEQHSSFSGAIDYYVNLWDKLIFCDEHHIANPYASDDINSTYKRQVWEKSFGRQVNCSI